MFRLHALWHSNLVAINFSTKVTSRICEPFFGQPASYIIPHYMAVMQTQGPNCAEGRTQMFRYFREYGTARLVVIYSLQLASREPLTLSSLGRFDSIDSIIRTRFSNVWSIGPEARL